MAEDERLVFHDIQTEAAPNIRGSRRPVSFHEAWEDIIRARERDSHGSPILLPEEPSFSEKLKGKRWP
ncbi:MAG: hypothetical protein ACQESR_02335 [Planctomycetota bacterium]